MPDMFSPWQLMPLGELADVSGGVALGRVLRGYGTVELPYLRVANVQSGYVDTSEVKYVRVLKSEVSVYGLEPGDFLMTEGGDFDKLGRGALWDGSITPCLYQNHIFRVRPDRSRLSPKFLSAYVGSDAGRRYFLGASKQTTNLATINRTQVRAFPVPVPSLAEQHGITEILDSVDESIRLAECVIAKLEQLQQALAVDLIVGPPPSTGETSDWSASPQPGRDMWPIRRLGSTLVSIDAGRSPDLPDRPATGDEWGVLKVSSIRAQGFNQDENKVVTQPHLFDERIEVRSGDLLISRANTPELVGLACYVRSVRPRLMLSDKTLRLVVDENQAHPEFLAHAMVLPEVRRQIERSGTGSSGSMKNISQEEIRSLAIPLPPLTEQCRIREILTRIGFRIQCERRQRVKLLYLKNGLVEGLLTGRMRVDTAVEAVEAVI